jgi:hypothetical protein
MTEIHFTGTFTAEPRIHVKTSFCLLGHNIKLDLLITTTNSRRRKDRNSTISSSTNRKGKAARKLKLPTRPVKNKARTTIYPTN